MNAAFTAMLVGIVVFCLMLAPHLLKKSDGRDVLLILTACGVGFLAATAVMSAAGEWGP